MTRIMVVAPHPDDETLGCGGALLRSSDEGDELAWVRVTRISVDAGFPPVAVGRRAQEIERISDAYGFAFESDLGFPTARLDEIPLGRLVSDLSRAFQEFEPDVLFLPWPGDIHSDHRVTFDACASASKTFRLPFVRRWLAYETLSETEAALPFRSSFVPNVFIDIYDYIDRKCELVSIYESEIGELPFPRSVAAVRALAISRGVAAGVQGAEAFALLRERL